MIEMFTAAVLGYLGFYLLGCWLFPKNTIRLERSACTHQVRVAYRGQTFEPNEIRYASRCVECDALLTWAPNA